MLLLGAAAHFGEIDGGLVVLEDFTSLVDRDRLRGKGLLLLLYFCSLDIK